jgi:hypothetical protein
MVDWVSSDGYNHNTTAAYCSSTQNLWCPFSTIFHNSPSTEQAFRGIKPFMVAETGSVEDPATPGRKGQWFLDAKSFLEGGGMPDLYALVYFNCDVTSSQGFNWRSDTSQSAEDGYGQLARSPFFTG